MSVQGKLFLSGINLIFLIVLFTFPNNAYSQSSRNGWYLPPHDTLHILYVFSEVLNDSIHDYYTYDSVWLPGQLPGNFDEVIDYEFTGEENIQGFMTKYFYDASFGKYIVLGDYIDTLIQINLDTLTGGWIDGYDQCIAFLNNLPDSNLSTKHGYKINSNYFDRISQTYWPFPEYGNHPINPDGKIDLITFVWRTNSNITKIDDSGYGTYSPPYSLKGKTTSHILNFRSSKNKPSVSRHEFAHTLVGSNQYHSGGSGGGSSYFLSNVTGYSILSSHNRNSEFCNGWDRWWLGWKDTSKTYFISALNQSDQEIDTDLEYGEYPSTGDSIILLRDFYDYGDVIRIELPYLDSISSDVKKQYLWLENHHNTDYYEQDKFRPGVYVNIQIGNNDTASDDSRTNYYYPLCGFGNYDFNYSFYDSIGKDEYYDFETDSTLSNPFTGYHFLMEPSYDLVSSGSPDVIYTKEWISFFNTVKWNGQELNDSVFQYPPAPYFGTIYDRFEEERALSISTNPAPVPVMTYKTKDKGSNSAPYSIPDTIYDNRYIFLNGLYIEIQDIEENGYAVIKLRYNHYHVENDVRWTGNIILYEDIILDANNTITLDQGLTPTRPVNPVTYDGKKVFADSTIFTCKDGSYFEINDDAELLVKDNSSLILESGSKIKIIGELKITGNGDVKVESGGEIEAVSGAIITIQDDNGAFNVETGSTYDLCDVTINGDGNGYIDGIPLIREFEDESLSGTSVFKAWNRIECNEDVTISDNANITFIAKTEVIINGPFETGSNVVMEIKTECPE